MSVPALVRRVPSLRDRPPPPDDPLSDNVRAEATDGTVLRSDVSAIDEVLVPAFQRADREAVLAQRRWVRRELGLLVLSGLLLIASSVQAAYGDAEAWPGVVVAAIGGVASVLAGTTRSSEARRVYLRTRREAERLRSLAWTHLTTTRVTAPDKRAKSLRQSVARIRLQTAEGSGDMPQRAEAGDHSLTQPRVPEPRSDDPTAEHLVDLYVEGRLQSQRRWYQSRQSEFESAERQGSRLRAAMLVVATALGAISASSILEPSWRPWLGVAATVATALSALTTGWMRLQGFDTRARLYELTDARLGVAYADRPLRLDAPLAERFVGECEDVLLSEHGAWTSQTPTSAGEASSGPSQAS